MTTDPSARNSPLNCNGHDIQVLQEGESEKYLGRKLSIDDFHICELDHRLASGWAAFFKFKGALCNKGIPLSNRIALFEAVVTPCVFVGSRVVVQIPEALFMLCSSASYHQGPSVNTSNTNGKRSKAADPLFEALLIKLFNGVLEGSEGSSRKSVN